MSDPIGLVFATVNAPWVYWLGRALALRGHPTTSVALYDVRNYWRIRPQWPHASLPNTLKRENWVFPTGYMGKIEPLMRPLLRLRWHMTLRELRKFNGETWIVCIYPWLLESLRGLNGDRLIYFNMDPYELYRPERAKLITAQENELVNRSRLILCLAQTQVETFRARFPLRSADIRHLPLAAPELFINPTPGSGFRPNTVGYVGNLIDRVDWRFVRAVASLLPHRKFVFVGYANVSSAGGSRPNWMRDRDEALALPNVHVIGPVPENDVPPHYWSFAITWIPYALDHSQNIGSCPSKIMDGLASGRPVLSTDVPECRLYPDWIEIMLSPEQAADLIETSFSELESPEAERKSVAQVDYIRRLHSYDQRADLLEKWMSEFRG